MTKMAAMLIYGKNPMKIFWADFDETWYEASETEAHYILFKLLPWNDFDLLYGKIRFYKIGFYMENVTIIDSLEIIASCDLEIGLYRELNE